MSASLYILTIAKRYSERFSFPPSKEKLDYLKTQILEIGCSNKKLHAASQKSMLVQRRALRKCRACHKRLLLPPAVGRMNTAFTLANDAFLSFLPLLVHFLSYTQIVEQLSLINKKWRAAVLSPCAWSNWSQERWKQWRQGPLCLLDFMFRKGSTDEEIERKERELKFKLRLDMKELLKHCSGVSFPLPFFCLYGENPAVFLDNINNWESWDEVSLREFGPAAFERMFDEHYKREHPEVSLSYIVIGQDNHNNWERKSKTFLLLQVDVWAVYRFNIQQQEPFAFLGSFDEWFLKGADFLKFETMSVIEDQDLDELKKLFLVTDNFSDFLTTELHKYEVSLKYSNNIDRIKQWDLYKLRVLDALKNSEVLSYFCMQLSQIKQKNSVRVGLEAES